MVSGHTAFATLRVCIPALTAPESYGHTLAVMLEAARRRRCMAPPAAFHAGSEGRTDSVCSVRRRSAGDEHVPVGRVVDLMGV